MNIDRNKIDIDALIAAATDIAEGGLGTENGKALREALVGTITVQEAVTELATLGLRAEIKPHIWRREGLLSLKVTDATTENYLGFFDVVGDKLDEGWRFRLYMDEYKAMLENSKPTEEAHPGAKEQTNGKTE